MKACGPVLLMLVALPLASCGWDDILGTASRTARNVCAEAPNCTVYDKGEPVSKDTLYPWDTKR
jgi:hypothetical protein